MKILLIYFFLLISSVYAREIGQTEITTEEGIEVYQKEKYYLLKKNVEIESDNFKLTAENSIIKPKSYNHFRSEVFEYDNISSLNFYEFKAELSKEKFLFIK